MREIPYLNDDLVQSLEGLKQSNKYVLDDLKIHDRVCYENFCNIFRIPEICYNLDEKFFKSLYDFGLKYDFSEYDSKLFTGKLLSSLQRHFCDDGIGYSKAFQLQLSLGQFFSILCEKGPVRENMHVDFSELEFISKQYINWKKVSLIVMKEVNPSALEQISNYFDFDNSDVSFKSDFLNCLLSTKFKSDLSKLEIESKKLMKLCRSFYSTNNTIQLKELYYHSYCYSSLLSRTEY